MNKRFKVMGNPLWLVPVLLLGIFIYVEGAHLECHRDPQSPCHVKPEPE